MSDTLLELPANLELKPGRIPEIDEHTRSVLAALILDETIELPSSERGNEIMYCKLTDEEFIALYKPLVEVLQLDPIQDRPPLREHINRASKLGLTPSVSPIYDRMSLSRVHSGLGFRAKFRFTDWSQSDFIEAGQRLAHYVKGRPTRDIITVAGRGEYTDLGDFPTVDDIKSRFGRIAVFHELIGYPSCKGWDMDDHNDWAFAFYRQNPGRELSAPLLERFSKEGKGPSKQPVLKFWGTINKYKQSTSEEFQHVISDEAQARSKRSDELQDLAVHEPNLLTALSDIPEQERTQERLLQVGAQYRLGKRLATLATDADLKRGALIKSADAFVRWCIANSNGRLTIAGVETHASALGVFDDMWPMYRFQNVDLTVAGSSL